MASLPSQTITFLCADLEDGSSLWAIHQEDVPSLLGRYELVIRQAIHAHGGALFRAEATLFCAAFSAAPDALNAAVALQRGVHAARADAPEPLRWRVALHTGAATRYDQTYIGPPLTRLAHLLDAGHGDQILLSRATWGLVYDHLPPDTMLRDLGLHRLRDFSLPEHIFQVVADGLPSQFPPLATLDLALTNLPPQPTTMIGRERECDDVCALLRRPDVRLLTLTGPGGAGKTRLGLQVAGALLDEFRSGVFFVALAPISDPALVAQAIAQTLDIKDRGSRPLLDLLKDALRDKQMLLLLDNFEQVVAAAPLLTELLAAVPGLKLLVTSRAVLRVLGEHEYAVPPLAVPDPWRLPSLERLTQYDAVRLFIERSRTVRSSFTVTDDNAPAIAEICHRLDGLPLAIELAAARSKLFTPQALLARLGSRLALLKSGAQDVPARQQTLRNTIDWSYNLLDASEQRLFARLAVFAGGGTLEAAEAVCTAEDVASGDASQTPFLDVLEALIDKSLLSRVESEDGETRFLMLETIREYALERLAAHGDEQTIRARHAGYYVTFAETAEPELTRAHQIEWLSRLEQELDNLRAAFQWALDQGQFEVAGKLTDALLHFWNRRGHVAEGRRWLAMVLAHEHALSDHTRATALFCAGRLAHMQGNYDEGTRLLERSLAIARAGNDLLTMGRALNMLGVNADEQELAQARELFEESLALFMDVEDEAGIAAVLNNLGTVAARSNDYPQALHYFQQSLALYREAGNIWGIAILLNNTGIVSTVQGRFAEAQTLLDESLERRRALGDKWGIGNALTNLADLAFAQGDLQRAAELVEQSMSINRMLEAKKGIVDNLVVQARLALHAGRLSEAQALCEEALVLTGELVYKLMAGDALHTLGQVALRQGDPARARDWLRQSLSLRVEIGDRLGSAATLETLAALALRQEDLTHAAQVYGAAAALRETIGAPIPTIAQADYTRDIAALRDSLGLARFADAWNQGRSLTPADVLASLHGTLHAQVIEAPMSGPTVTAALRPGEPALPAGLTSREAEVLRLVAQGLTNPQIAEQLVLSPFTVNAHLRSIYGKIGVTTRSAATRFALDNSLV